MTRIYTFGLEQETPTGGAYLVVQVAHRDTNRAARVALAHAAQERGGRWAIVHKACRRTGVAIPRGEVLGATGPFEYTLDEA